MTLNLYLQRTASHPRNPTCTHALVPGFGAGGCDSLRLRHSSRVWQLKPARVCTRAHRRAFRTHRGACQVPRIGAAPRQIALAQIWAEHGSNSYLCKEASGAARDRKLCIGQRSAARKSSEGEATPGEAARNPMSVVQR